jgi:hypothetical protein
MFSSGFCRGLSLLTADWVSDAEATTKVGPYVKISPMGTSGFTFSGSEQRRA